MNLARTAAYLVNAARRITGAVRDGTPLATAVSAEAGNARSHVAATTSRMDAARRIDEQAATGATTFRWRAVKDSRVDPECRRLDGRQFDLAKPPNGKYPGQVHPHCRCTAVPVTSTNLSKETVVNDHEILSLAYARSAELPTPPAESSAADAEAAWLAEQWPHLFDSDVQRSGKAIRDEAEASKAWSWQRPQEGWDADGNQAPAAVGRLFDYPAAPPRDPAAERDTEARERAQAWADRYAREAGLTA